MDLYGYSVWIPESRNVKLCLVETFGRFGGLTVYVCSLVGGWEREAQQPLERLERTQLSNSDKVDTHGGVPMVLVTLQGQKAHTGKRIKGQKGFHQIQHFHCPILFWALIHYFLSPELAQMEACLDENPDFFMVSSNQIYHSPTIWPSGSGLPDAKRKSSDDRQVVDRPRKGSRRRHGLLLHKSNQVNSYTIWRTIRCIIALIILVPNPPPPPTE